jgi:broad specificity phosphatase PhoE
LLIRHGQSEWNAIGRWQGQADPALSELGRRQAAQAAQSIGVVDAIVASDLERASMTAHIIAEMIGVGPVLTHPSLRERHAGEWQGMTRPEIELAFPGWLGEGRFPEGFESVAATIDRVMPVLTGLAVMHPHGDVLVVTHGGVILAVEQELGAKPAERFPNLGGMWFDYEEKRGWRPGERVHLIPPDIETGSPQL